MNSMLSIIAASRRRAAFDADAADYFARIVTAGSSISAGNKLAVDAFVKGCKADGIWSAIKASCLLAGPDTLAGALVPLVGPAPTNYNFVAGDHSRTAGLLGNGTTKYLSSNRNNNADPQDNQHLAAYSTQASTSFGYHVAFGAATTGTSMLPSETTNVWRSRQFSVSGVAATQSVGLSGISRSNSANYVTRTSGTNQTLTATSESPANGILLIYCRGSVGSPATISNGRLAFYSIGESLDLALLDARLTTYMASLT